MAKKSVDINYKVEIEKILLALKTKGIDREMIEKDLGLSKNYLDQALSRGGNKSIYERVKMYSSQQSLAIKYGLEDIAAIQVLIKEVIKLKSSATGLSPDVYRAEFDQEVTLALNDLRKKFQA